MTYNIKKCSSTGLTPHEARKPQNEQTVYLNVTLKAKHNIKYPDINIGDKDLIYMKRMANQRSHISLWSVFLMRLKIYQLLMVYNFIKLQPEINLFLRHELLKIILKNDIMYVKIS